MIYTNYDKDGKLNSFIVACHCGCGNLQFKTIDDTVYISLYGSSWYNHQGLGTIRDTIDMFVEKFKKKKVYLCGILLTLEEVEQFFNLSLSLPFGGETDDRYNNESHLECEYIHIIDEKPESDECELQICLDSNIGKIIRNKAFRGTEICLKKQEWANLIINMKSSYNKEKEKYFKKE